MATVQNEDQMFDLTEGSIEDKSISNVQYMWIPENTNAWSQNGGKPSQQTLYFTCTPGGNWILPGESYLYVQFNVQAANATAYTTPTTAFQNGFPLFDAITYNIDGSPIENTAQWLSKKLFIRKLLTYSRDVDSSSFLDTMWAPDTGAGGANITRERVSSIVTQFATNPAATGNWQAGVQVLPDINYNSGFVRRAFCLAAPNALNALPITAYANPMTFGGAAENVAPTGFNYFPETTSLYEAKIYLRDMVDLFDYWNKVTTGSTHVMQLKYNPNFNQLFHCLSAPTNAPQIVIANMFWVMPYIKPNPLVDLKLTGLLTSGFQNTIDYEAIDVQLCPFQSLTTSFNWAIPVNNPGRPTKVLIGFQNPNQLSNNLTGAPYTLSAFTFSSMVNNNNMVTDACLQNWWYPATLNQITVTWGGVQVPTPAYQPTTYGLTQNYQDLLNLCNRGNDREGGMSVSFLDYQMSTCLYGFDLRFIDTSNVTAGLNNTIVLNFNVTGTIPAAPANGILVWAFVFTESQARVSSSGNKLLLTRL